jgi:hypothetical protein
VVLIGVLPARAPPRIRSTWRRSPAAFHIVEGGTGVVSFGFTGLSEVVR